MHLSVALMRLQTLSGGEQSSIQLSMLQSLASISFSPIHMFDEVDVYMDERVRVKKWVYSFSMTDVVQHRIACAFCGEQSTPPVLLGDSSLRAGESHQRYL